MPVCSLFEAGVHGSQATSDYGTAIAAFIRNKSSKWSFSKSYFEPEFKGGNFGVEQCVQQ